MTRINCIDPYRIPLLPLKAEYREMLRVRHVHPRQTMPQVPTYRMGAGHVLFFADKGRWLLNRHAALRDELRRRGVKVNFELDLSHWPDWAMGQWEPDTDAKLISMARLINRVVNGQGSR